MSTQQPTANSQPTNSRRAWVVRRWLNFSCPKCHPRPTPDTALLRVKKDGNRAWYECEECKTKFEAPRFEMALLTEIGRAE